MSSSVSRIPNFAGVALVDILANGVAVLVIVIVLSIAARAEKEERYSEKVQEIATVMTREFSTSLVLNRMAASPPAQLHDYENSPIDSVWNPEVMPVLEFHRYVVRDPYSGKVWTRNELLQTPNSLDEHLVSMSTSARANLRGDIYDVGTYYLLMSILRDHDIRIWHWHFIGGIGGSETASTIGDCPPGIPFEDCYGSNSDSLQNAPALPDFGELLGSTPNDAQEDLTDPSWPPGGDEPGANQDRSSRLHGSAIPEGSRMGVGQPSADPSAMGSFPDARAPSSRGSGSLRGSMQGTENANQSSFQLRLADPDAVGEQDGGLSPEVSSMRDLLGALMLYLSDLQEFLDKKQPPTELLENFLIEVAENLDELDRLTDEQLRIVDELHDSIELSAQFESDSRVLEPVPVSLIEIEGLKAAMLRVLPNRLLLDIEAIVDPESIYQEFDLAIPKLSLNRYPDIWRGLNVTLSQGSIVLAPLPEGAVDKPHWRAVAHLSAQRDDVVVGFLYSTIDEDGFLNALADSNRVKLDGRSIAVHADVGFFGVKTWLVLLYIVLGAMILALLLFWRPGVRRPQ